MIIDELRPKYKCIMGMNNGDVVIYLRNNENEINSLQ